MNNTKSSAVDKSAQELPVLPMRNVVIFPGMPSQILIGRESSLALVADILAGQKRLFAVSVSYTHLTLPTKRIV